MKLALLISICLAGLTTAKNLVIASFGSSYASGYGLNKTMCEILQENLKKPDGTEYDIMNLAEPGSRLRNVSVSQAPKMAGHKPVLAYVIAGGSDLEYIACMNEPFYDRCIQRIAPEEFRVRYMQVLDSLVDVVHGDPTIPIYILTYIRALGEMGDCSEYKPKCRFTPRQFGNLNGIYGDLVNQTILAVEQWKKDGDNAKYNVRLLDAHRNSTGHEATNPHPWVNNNEWPAQRGIGHKWHPNPAGAEAMAKLIYDDFNKIPDDELPGADDNW